MDTGVLLYQTFIGIISIISGILLFLFKKSILIWSQKNRRKSVYFYKIINDEETAKKIHLLLEIILILIGVIILILTYGFDIVVISMPDRVVVPH